jgi:hypothetical protein
MAALVVVPSPHRGRRTFVNRARRILPATEHLRADCQYHVRYSDPPNMAGPLPFRPHDDPDQDGENDDEEEDVDETVCADDLP